MKNEIEKAVYNANNTQDKVNCMAGNAIKMSARVQFVHCSAEEEKRLWNWLRGHQIDDIEIIQNSAEHE